MVSVRASSWKLTRASSSASLFFLGCVLLRGERQSVRQLRQGQKFIVLILNLISNYQIIKYGGKGGPKGRKEGTIAFQPHLQVIIF